MPELPEVEFMSRNLECWTKGKSIVATEGIDNASYILQKNISSCFRRGKYCILSVGDFFIVIHFRMTGKVVLLRGERKFLRKKLILDDGMEIGILDQRKFSTFEVLTSQEYNNRFINLGEEVWPIHRDAAWYRERLSNRRSTIKSLFLRQDIIAGLGNIMCSEICFRIRCHPQRKASEIQMEQWKLLDKAIHEFVGQVLSEEEGEEINYVSQGGALPKSFLVYGRAGQPCIECGATIVQWQMSGRATYACLSCQSFEA